MFDTYQVSVFFYSFNGNMDLLLIPSADVAIVIGFNNSDQNLFDYIIFSTP